MHQGRARRAVKLRMFIDCSYFNLDLLVSVVVSRRASFEYQSFNICRSISLPILEREAAS